MCSSFYVCVNGQLVQQSCAPGLSWNVDSGMCDWNYKVKCLGRKKLAEQYTFKDNLHNPKRMFTRFSKQINKTDNFYRSPSIFSLRR